MTPGTAMIIVKLGGSLAKAATLRGWLACIARHGGGRVVLVPGGGVFADAVRAAQAPYGFSDEAADRMAILAMEQYAVMLADLEPGLRLARSEAEIRAALAANGVALWQPCAMLEAAAGLTASWEVTSDSLAAWLARRLGAGQLLLVKSAPSPDAGDARQWAALGLVDAQFPAAVEDAGFALGYYGPGDEVRLAEALAAEERRP